jgi:hypothetical protein
LRKIKAKSAPFTPCRLSLGLTKMAEEEVCGDEEAVCYLCLGGGWTKLINHCDAIVHVEAQMPDLSTSRALHGVRSNQE